MLSKLFMPQDNNVGPSLEQRAQTLGQASLKFPSPYTQSTQSVQASTATPPTPVAKPAMQQMPQLPSIQLNMPQQTPAPAKEPPPEPLGKEIGEGIKTENKGPRVGEPTQEMPPIKQGPQRMANPSLSLPSANIGPSYASQSVAGVSTAGGNFSLNSRPQVTGECGPGFKKGYDGRCYPIFGG